MPFTDLLFRSEFTEIVLNIVNNKVNEKKGFSLAIDGEWGCGKTTMLDILQEKLKPRYLVVRYNCWKNDIYEDPLVPLLCEFASTLNNESFVKDLDYEKKALKIAGTTIEGLLKLLRFPVDLTIEAISNIVKPAADTIHSIHEIVEEQHIKTDNVGWKTPIEFLIGQVQDILGQFMGVENHGIILMIDELDRCLPDYAIKVLERLHHICFGTRIVLITAVNKKELSGSIAKAFGQIDSENKDSFAEHYLQKFIDFTVHLNNGLFAEPDISFLGGLEQQFVDDSVFDLATFNDWCREILSGIPMRNIQQIIKKIGIFHSLIEKKRPCRYGKYSKSLLLAEIIDSVTFFYLHSEHHAETIEYIGPNGHDQLSYVGFDKDDKYKESSFGKHLEIYTNGFPSNADGNDKQEINGPKSVLKYLYRNTDKNAWEFEDNVDKLFKEDDEGLWLFREQIRKICGIKVFNF